MNRARCRLAALLMAAAAVAPAWASDALLAAMPRVDGFLAALERHQRGMGSLAVAQGDHPALLRAVGQAEPGVAATPQTRYAIGSISKLFTAVLVLQLVDEERLALETPLARFFPDLPSAGTITIRHLLAHRSGLADIKDLPGFEQWMRQPRSRDEIVQAIASLPSRFAPGTRAEYSNSGALLLSLIVERLRGRTYGQALRAHIAQPLGLADTLHDEAATPPRLARSYRWHDGWQPVEATHASVPLGSGAVVSTPRDLVRFMRALLRGQLLSAASLGAMQQLVDGFGLGLYAMNDGGIAGLGHEGTIDGFAAVLVHFPDRDLTLAWCGNAARFPREALAHHLARTLLDPAHQPPTFEPIEQVVEFALDAGPHAPSQRYTVRGNAAPLSWFRGLELQRDAVDGLWKRRETVTIADGEWLEYKYLRDDREWERRDNRRHDARRPAASARWNHSSEREQLHAEILEADGRLFGAFNRREAAPLHQLFSPRLEFFHDVGGLAGHTQTIEALTRNFNRPGRTRRELLGGTVEVFPIPGLGAMQFGSHRFCNRESADAAESCQLLRFAHVWERTGQGWQLLRVLSYDH